MRKLFFLHGVFFIFGAFDPCCYSMEGSDIDSPLNEINRVTLSFSTQFKTKFRAYLKNHSSELQNNWKLEKDYFINYVSLKFDFNGWVVENKGGNALSLEVLYGIKSRVNCHDLFVSQYLTHGREEKTRSAIEHMTMDEYDNTFEKYHHHMDNLMDSLRDFIVEIINASNSSNISI